ncbi:MAG: 3-oxoadipyl-CoA thiolase [Chitinophagaceae bacterium]|nr:3-oxoadipyl-CoA thiolase [Chitinophagaceae bacterium]
MNAYIVDGIRTPIGSFGGSLSPVRADDLAALVIKELMKRNQMVPASEINDVIMGCVNQAGDDNRNVARMALLLAGIPYTVPGETVNRLCASGMSAVINAARSIQCDDGDLFIAGGVEHMTRGPYVISKSSKAFGTDAQMYDSSFGWRFINPLMEKMYGVDAMGVTAENLATMYNISRQDQDAFAYQSQLKAAKAKERLSEEIIPVEIPSKKTEATFFANDEFVKPSTTIEGLSKLKPAFKKENGTVTAGNSSGLNDGAAAILIVSDTALNKYNLTPKAKITSSAVVGVEPRIMGIGPVDATKKALAKAGLTLKDIDIIELNEAFAAQSIACIRELGLKDDDARINVNGGAIALGHPLGMSGARIVYSAALELQNQGKRYALATMCIGVGQGYAVVLQRV